MMGLRDLPVSPPVSPMLATLTRRLPAGDHCYEPKWDGFRCLAFRAGSETLLSSRNQRPLDRYFPELVEGLLAIGEDRFVLDGEIVVAGPRGLDFSALMLRLHPSSSRVVRLRTETPASFVAFDVLASDHHDLRPLPLMERRERLVELLAAAPPAIAITPATADRGVAESWLKNVHGRWYRRRGGQGRRVGVPDGPTVQVLAEGEARANGGLRGGRVSLG